MTRPSPSTTAANSSGNIGAEAPLRGRAWWINALLRVFSFLPLSALHRIGQFLAWVSTRLKREEWHVARVNADLCFPEWPAERREWLAREALRENAKGLVELAALWQWPVSKVLRLIKSVDGTEVIDEALAEGKGLLVIAPASWCLGSVANVAGAARVTACSVSTAPGGKSWKHCSIVAVPEVVQHFGPPSPRVFGHYSKPCRPVRPSACSPISLHPAKVCLCRFFGHPAKTMTPVW